MVKMNSRIRGIRAAAGKDGKEMRITMVMTMVAQYRI